MKWISVKERLPKPMDFKVLLCLESGEVFQGYLGQFHNQFHSMRYMGKIEYPTVTHWMPLPEPPTKD